MGENESGSCPLVWQKSAEEFIIDSQLRPPQDLFGESRMGENESGSCPLVSCVAEVSRGVYYRSKRLAF
ncbi:hypothetical protein JTE90_001312 [Oedothorax gibbosus]|uniref:Uncharacterized protein n=1 Tax=Oedothorax gibbosus TaxID=931172 RepID=A0AAV6U252_9ARAC|nr:hypothetical protein JTE90_001312 [Oedothorax gibbosus]